MAWILSLLSSPILGKLEDAYEVWKNAETQEAKLEAEQHLAWLTAQKEVIISEQRSKLTSWIRPALAFPVVVYVWKLIIWDTVLQWGVTPYPGEIVNWIVITVISAFMLTRWLEKR